MTTYTETTLVTDILLKLSLFTNEKIEITIRQTAQRITYARHLVIDV